VNRSAPEILTIFPGPTLSTANNAGRAAHMPPTPILSRRARMEPFSTVITKE